MRISYFSYGLLISLVALPLTAEPLPAPLTDADFRALNMAEVRLGQNLFYDPVLSGNRNISCGSCHHPKFATGDGLSLGLGEGGIGLGPERVADPANLPEQLIPRNAPPLFNIGARQVTVLFADGRIENDPSRPSGIRSPLEDEMVLGFDNIVSAQTMFPVLSPDEMAGHYNENEVSRAVRRGLITGENGAWDLISKRVAGIDEYQDAFEAVYPDIAAGRAIAFTDISNAIAAFMEFEWRADDSLFDAVLRGQATFEAPAAEGATLFYGDAKCASCHSGTLLSDFGFHAMGQPQLGPGKAERFESHQRDIGRMRVTGRGDDAYRFRTPMLRNVVETGPWGHAGAFTNLTEFLSFHSRGEKDLASVARDAVLPELPGSHWAVLDDVSERQSIEAAALPGPDLGDDEIKAIVAFLETLSDPVSLRGRLGIPDGVPSGLDIDR